MCVSRPLSSFWFADGASPLDQKEEGRESIFDPPPLERVRDTHHREVRDTHHRQHSPSPVFLLEKFDPWQPANICVSRGRGVHCTVNKKRSTTLANTVSAGVVNNEATSDTEQPLSKEKKKGLE